MRIGKYILNHSFMTPRMVATVSSVVIGFLVAKVVCVPVIISERLRILDTDRLLAAFQPVATPASGRGSLYGGLI